MNYDMTPRNEYTEVRQFLEAQGIRIRNLGNHETFNFAHSVEFDRWRYTQTEKGICLSALSYFLQGELGRHWDKQLWMSIAYLFEQEQRDTIEQAIDYFETLAKQE